MKVVSLIGNNQDRLLECAGTLAEVFNRKELKVGLFIDSEESHQEKGLFHGSVKRYENKTILEVGEAFELDNLMSVCCCDFLLGINLKLPQIPKVYFEPQESDPIHREDTICIIDSKLNTPIGQTLPNFDIAVDGESIVSYLLLNSTDMISNKNIELNEEFVKYADTAQKNVAVVKIKSKYGYEMNCIKKTFTSFENADREAVYASILNSTLKVYPSVIDVVNAVLYREFVDGDKLDQVMSQYTSDEGERAFYYLESIVLSVIDTMNFIHNELENHYGEAYILGGVQFTNFLVTEDTVYYLELEKIEKGDSVKDYEYFAAYLLETESIRTNDKRHLINSIINYVNNSFYYKRELKWTGIEEAFRTLEIGGHYGGDSTS